MSLLTTRRLRVSGLIAALTCSFASLTLAEPDTGAPDAGPVQSASEHPLAPLPAVPSQDLPPPSADALEAVKDLLGRVVSEDPVIRERAVRELVEAEPKWVSAIAHQLNQLADSTKGEELKRKLLDIRDKARSVERERMKAAGKRGKVVTPDYMDMLAEFSEPKNADWQAVTQVVAMSRMLREIGTTPAVRTLIQVYVRFGEFLRVDTQLQLEKLGDKALPALIETRRHQAPRIAHWADRQLDALGKAIPSEAVQTPDPDVLADVLRAYGYIRDPDAARVVISFANSERPQVREASRQAVALMKEIANWPLRDTYANIVGKKPPADWAWDRTARELFGEFDRLRLAQVYKLFDQGKALQKAGKLAEAKEAFDKVLARSPLFDRRGEMIDTYVAFAEKHVDEEPEKAEAALRRARRLSNDDGVDKRVQSLLWYLEGQELVARGVADQVPFRRALELDPDNQRAKRALEEIQRGEQKQKKQSDHYLAAGAIGIVALLAIAVIALRRGSPEPRLPEKAAPKLEPAADDSATQRDDGSGRVSEAASLGGEEAVEAADDGASKASASRSPAAAGGTPELNTEQPSPDSPGVPSPPTPTAEPQASPAVATLHFPTVSDDAATVAQTAGRASDPGETKPDDAVARQPGLEGETEPVATPPHTAIEPDAPTREGAHANTRPGSSAAEPAQAPVSADAPPASGAADPLDGEVHRTPPEPQLPPLPGLEGGGELTLPPIDDD
ncbi:MAG: hypothetical protein R3B89_29820 [Polyangiaceae bacterium]